MRTKSMTREPFIEKFIVQRTTSSTVLDELERQEQISSLRQALKELPDEDYQVLRVRHRLDPQAPKPAALADSLGCSRKTVYIKAEKVRQHLLSVLLKN